MNPYTGDVVALPDEEDKRPRRRGSLGGIGLAAAAMGGSLAALAAASSAARDALVPLPDHLQGIARRKLDGKPAARVNLRSSSPLAQWAADERARACERRREATKKRRKKMAQESRRRNRK